MSLILRVSLGLVVLMCAALPASAQLMPPITPLLAVPVPPENPITESKRVLGKILFWDEQLSSDNTVACGTCHRPAAGGSDPRIDTHPGLDSIFGTADDVTGSSGVVRSDVANAYTPDTRFGLSPQVTPRWTPTFIGVQWSPELFWDGRAGSTFMDPQNPSTVSIASGGALENQAVAPILGSGEMAHDGRGWPEVIAKLQAVPPLQLATNIPPDMANALTGGVSYPSLFQSAYGDPQITAERIGFAIATYERTLVPDQTPWDLFVAGNVNALTQSQTVGWNILYNNTVCLNCHTPPEFTDHQFHNIGLRPSIEDLGRELVTGNFSDRGRFKTPTLRNVGLRTRLMHVGWITDVQDSIDFYNANSVFATGHVQFTLNQSPIPPANASYANIAMPTQFQPMIVDFLVNGLTDPRVAAETFPFDRPTLHSELPTPNPATFGSGSGGAGGFVPFMLAMSPATFPNPDFKIGVGGALGGALAYLGLSTGVPPAGTSIAGIPLHIEIGPANLVILEPLAVSGAGAGSGYATYQLPLPVASGISGVTVYGQWFVVDGAGVANIAASDGAHWTLF